MGIPTEPDNNFEAKWSTTQERRKREIADIEFFIRDRCDAPHTLTLKSLHRLNDRDLAWLAQAIANA